MFKQFFRSTYKSQKTLTKKKIEELETELEKLKSENRTRHKQIEKFLFLIEEDSLYEKKYHARIKANAEQIASNNIKIETIENILLDR